VLSGGHRGGTPRGTGGASSLRRRGLIARRLLQLPSLTAPQSLRRLIATSGLAGPHRPAGPPLPGLSPLTDPARTMPMRSRTAMNGPREAGTSSVGRYRDAFRSAGREGRTREDSGPASSRDERVGPPILTGFALSQWGGPGARGPQRGYSSPRSIGGGRAVGERRKAGQWGASPLRRRLSCCSSPLRRRLGCSALKPSHAIPWLLAFFRCGMQGGARCRES